MLLVQEAPKGIAKIPPIVIVYNLRCPICRSWWVFEAMAEICRLSEIEGAFLEEDGNGKKNVRFNTTRIGAHSLCGVHSAKRAATVVDNGEQYRPWTVDDERFMWGYLKDQANFAGFITSRRPSEEIPLRDDQQANRYKILGGGLTISKARCERMKLNDWIRRGQKS